jgi:hypothetical protein
MNGRRDIQSASNGKDAIFLSDLLHKSPVFCPKSRQAPTNLGYRPENGQDHLTLRNFEHEISNLAPGGWRVPQRDHQDRVISGQNKDNRKRL